MWIDGILNSRVTHAVELEPPALRKSRQGVLAENIANIDTPDYQSRRLDEAKFQGALRRAFSDAEKSDERQLRSARMKCASTPAARCRLRPRRSLRRTCCFTTGRMPGWKT